MEGGLGEPNVAAGPRVKEPAEPHAGRRARLLRAHPEVAKLQGPEWRSKYIAAGLAAGHLACALALAPRLPLLAWLACVYAVGATATQALFLAVHELAHDLFFRDATRNRLFSLLVNVPLVVPFAIAFRGYHLEHHQYQGVVGVDTDLPSAWERRVVRGTPAKVTWLSLQIVAYAVRPVLVRAQRWTAWHAANAAVQAAALAALFGIAAAPWQTLAYLLACLLVAGGLHPCAGHFVSEHYVLGDVDGDASPQETTSYYGVLNRVTWNVGYHNEHHDLPRVPWSRLPALRAAAPEFYAPLRACPSWCGALWEYATRADVGPWSRVTRSAVDRPRH